MNNLNFDHNCFFLFFLHEPVEESEDDEWRHKDDQRERVTK